MTAFTERVVGEQIFRQSPKVDLWSAVIHPGVPYGEFVSTVAQSAATDQQRYTGFISLQQGVVTSFTRTRYPRQRYGVSTIEVCQRGMEDLAESFGTTVLPDPQTQGFRVVLGLIEGYDTSNRHYSLQEVGAALGRGFAISAATVFALRHQGDTSAAYTEPVAVVRGDDSADLDRVFTVANQLRQERFAVEDFSIGKAYMVETPHCTQPD